MRKLLAALLFCAACSPAQADRMVVLTPITAAAGNARIAIASAPEKIRAPYDVEVLREDGSSLATHALKDRFYVQGEAGGRYIVRVSNPTANRVEAVVTVDGLDVVDGEAGDLHKRGYVVPPYGDVRIEGFRTSSDDVATFRFSSVDDSYAGKKGKARNVGVIAVAIFEEKAAEQQQVIIGDVDDDGGDYQPPPVGKNQRYRYEDDVVSGRTSVSRAPSAPTGGGARPATVKAAPPPADDRDYDEGGYADAGASMESEDMPAPPREMPSVTHRPGLGTEFGEQRYSAASFTRFVRAGDRPIAIAELRYNDAAGLLALGINAATLPDPGEVMTRETADPFPGDERFATPPN